MSSAVSWTESGCAGADGAGSTEAIETLASATILRMSSEENSANMIATADATKTLARTRDETEGRRFRKRFVNSRGSGSSLYPERNRGTDSCGGSSVFADRPNL